MNPLFLLPLVGGALMLFAKGKRGSVSVDRPSEGGAAGLPIRTEFPSTAKPRTKQPTPRATNPRTKPGGGVDSLPIRSPGQPTSPGVKVDPITGGPVTGEIPEALLRRIAETLAGQNAAAMRALAKELRQLGYAEQALTLEQAADAIDAAKEAAKKAKLPRVPKVKLPPPIAVLPIPAPEPPELPKIVVPDPVVEDITYDPDPRRNLALKVQRHMNTHPGDSYDKELITQWQKQEGCKPADGLYGYCSGMAFLKYKLVPPKPRTTLSAKNKKLWHDNLKYQGRVVDPPRQAEYYAAAVV